MSGNVRRWLALVLAAAFFSVGCGGGTGNVSGKVDLDGKTLKTGTVTFIAADGKGFVSPIDSEGNYAIQDIPAGEAKVMVQSHDPRRLASGVREGKPYGPTAEERKNWFPIPAKYADPASSGLTYVVKPGENPWDINLTKD